jgi:ABC-type phosphate/phosphonate transport system ATPase subunit
MEEILLVSNVTKVYPNGKKANEAINLKVKRVKL